MAHSIADSAYIMYLKIKKPLPGSCMLSYWLLLLLLFHFHL